MDPVEPSMEMRFIWILFYRRSRDYANAVEIAIGALDKSGQVKFLCEARSLLQF